MSQFRGLGSLPRFAKPRSYDLRLSPDLTAGSFEGELTIIVDVLQKTRWIVLHAVDIVVDNDSVYFTPCNSPQVPLLLMKQFVETEIMVLEFCEFIPVGEGVLSLTFNGVLNDQMKGFCRCGENKNMAVTQFEPADARRCFPCWDEPDFKATFKITLEVPTDLVALSNMPIIEEKVNGNLKIVSFQESPIMSTYLVAIVVGLFDYLEDRTSDGIQVRLYCQVGKADQGKFALHVGLKTLDLFKEYFAVPYPLPKLDMIAVPDFVAESSENYGLIAHLETSLLYDEHHSVASNKAPSDDPMLGTAPDASQLNQFVQILGLFFNPQYTEKIKILNPKLQIMTLKPEFMHLLNSTEAMQQMVIFQQALFSGYWHTISRALEQTGATEGTGNNAKKMEIFAGDVVVNTKTGAIGIVSESNLSVIPIAKAELEQLRKEEVVVVSRSFQHGQNISSVTDRSKLGVICGIEKKVDLASSMGDITHRNIGTESLERIRSFFVNDLVVYGSWVGQVTDLELSINARFTDGTKLRDADPDPEVLQPIFKNAVEKYLNEPYYKGQSVVFHSERGKAIRGYVVSHKVNTVTVNWLHTSVEGEMEPPQVLRYNQVERLHNPSFSQAAWVLGERCILGDEDFLVAGLRTRVTVKWQTGMIETVNSIELVETRKENFRGQFVSKKNENDSGFVRAIVDEVAWIKWKQAQQPGLLYSFELRRDRDYRFRISDLVVRSEASSTKQLGFVMDIEDCRLQIQWEDDSTSIVSPEEIIRLIYFIGSDDDDEVDDYSDAFDDDQNDDHSSRAVAFVHGRHLEPVSSADDNSEDEFSDDDGSW